jgi:hypothetical protein
MIGVALAISNGPGKAIQYIESTYRIKSEKRNNAVAGLSMGEKE